MKPILHTERFTLYPWQNTLEQNQHLRQMMQNEDVQKYIRGHAYSDQEVTEAFIKMQKNTTDQFGMWMIYQDDICAGMCLLKALPTEASLGYYETGYWLKPSHWGMGIAGEVANRMVKYAFDELNLPCVVGVTHEDNIASQKSLEKAGLKRQTNIKAYEQDLPFFIINNPHHMQCIKPTIQTKRFRLIPWRNNPTQNKQMIWMMKSPEVQKYVNGQPYSDSFINQAIPKMATASNQLRGFGIWMIYDMSAAQDIFVGTVFLKSTPADEPLPYEIGFWLKPEFWGKGIAAEVAGHIVTYAFEQLNLPHIVATAEAENIASQKTLTNIGFTQIADAIEDGQSLPQYKITNKNHEKSNKPILHTERFTLLPWVYCTEFTHHMSEMMQDTEVQKHVYEHALSDDEMTAQLSRMTTICQQPDLGYWMIFDNDTCVGMALLKPIEAENGAYSAEVGYWLKPKFWGQAIAAEVTKQLVKYGFEMAKLDVINAVTHADNIGSQKSLLNAGLTRQGTVDAYDQQLPYFEIRASNYKTSS
ncbi:MAG: GNAT family N-acetyltransferase [Alphaproteobacteria bacterium]|nr:GNAT family N-acetyltransferase [Alphaproteobacteria bacterium]